MKMRFICEEKAEHREGRGGVVLVPADDAEAAAAPGLTRVGNGRINLNFSEGEPLAMFTVGGAYFVDIEPAG